MMTAKGLAKLIEECGELQQVAGKKLAYFYTDGHPDGGPPLSERLEDEMADVMAACLFVARELGLDIEKIHRRRARKLARFNDWHAETGNNGDAIDRLEKGES